MRIFLFQAGTCERIVVQFLRIIEIFTSQQSCYDKLFEKVMIRVSIGGRLARTDGVEEGENRSKNATDTQDTNDFFYIKKKVTDFPSLMYRTREEPLIVFVMLVCCLLVLLDLHSNISAFYFLELQAFSHKI